MESELLLQDVLDSAALEIIILDEEKKITEVNAELLRQTGLERTLLLGREADQLWDASSLERLYRGLWGGRIFQGRLFEISSRGERRGVQYAFSPMMDVAGEIQGYVGMGHPVEDLDLYERELKRQIQQIRLTQGVAMIGLAKLAEYRDPETGQHLERMRNYSRLIAEEVSTYDQYANYVTEDYIEAIYNCSPLHDIGKVGIPDAILLKPGRLTPQEFEIMKTHSRIGGDALQAADKQLEGESFLMLGKEITYHHHEKWDGTGYPDGLAKETIPLSARIVAIADVYDALTSKRVYKEAIAHDQARAILIESAGQHFAEEMVRAFLKRETDILDVRRRYKD